MTMPRRTRTTAAGFGVLVLALVAGCGSADDDTAAIAATAVPAAPAVTASSPAPTNGPGDATDPGATARGTTGTGSRDAGRQGTGGPSGDATSGAPARSRTTAVPTTPGDYGEALLAAWAAGDTAAINRLAGPSAAASLTGAGTVSGLLRTACEDDMCSWSNEQGKRVTMTFDTAKVADGRPQAVTAIKVA